MVLEMEWRDLFANTAIEVFVNRIDSPVQISPASLQSMVVSIKAAVDLILPDEHLHAAAYGCTAASMEIGEQVIADLLQGSVEQASAARRITSNPFTAAKAAMAHLRVKKLAVLSPYVASVNTDFYHALQSAGVDIVKWASLNLAADNLVGNMDPDHVPELIQQLMSSCAEKPDAIFISCTNFRAMAQLAALEDRFGCRFITSNQAMAWHLLQQLKVQPGFSGQGALLDGL